VNRPTSILLLALPLLLAACSRQHLDAAPDAQAAATATASASAASVPGTPCTITPAVAIEHGARLDTGLTAVQMGDEVAIGYAVGADTPKVAFVAASGIKQVDADWSHLKDKEPKVAAGVVRHVMRVTPLGVRAGRMRVGIDLRDSPSDPHKRPRTAYLRCGPADEEPIDSDTDQFDFEDPTETQLAAYPDSASDILDCRTFGDSEDPWVVATRARRAGKDNHDIVYQWIVDPAHGKAAPADPVIDKREVKPKTGAYPKVEHFVAPVGLRIPGAGVMIVARDQGTLVVARRTNALEKAGPPTSMWLGAAAGMPALSEEKGTVLLATTEWQKSDLFASSFTPFAAAKKPAKVPAVGLL